MCALLFAMCLANQAVEMARIVTGALGPFYDPRALAAMNSARTEAAASAGLHTEHNKVLLILLDGLRYDFVTGRNAELASLLDERVIGKDGMVRSGARACPFPLFVCLLFLLFACVFVCGKHLSQALVI